MCLFLWVFPVYVACVFLLLFCMNQCVCRVFVCFNLVSKFKVLVGIVEITKTTERGCESVVIELKQY
jgi:hypothetical protein